MSPIPKPLMDAFLIKSLRLDALLLNSFSIGSNGFFMGHQLNVVTQKMGRLVLRTYAFLPH
jgi:hypothetical protein